MGKYSIYILFLLISLLVLILYSNGFGPLDSAQRGLNDFLCRVTAPDDVRPNIALIRIDGHSQNEYGAWPWNHDRVADLLAAVATGEPKAIAANFELTENAHQVSAGYTDVLAGQLTWIKNVVLPYDIALATFRSGRTSNPNYLFNNSITVDNPLGLMDEGSSLQVRKVFLPAEKLLATKPYLGFSYTMPDDDRLLRRQRLVMNYEGYYYPSLSLLAAAVYLDVPPDQIRVRENDAIYLGDKRRIPIGEGSAFVVTFPAENGFVSYSATEVLSEGFDLSQLKGKLVMVGADNFGDLEAFQTPVQSNLTALGVRAAVAENIINDNFLNPEPGQRLIITLILLALGGLAALRLPQMSVLYRLVVISIGLVILVNVTYFLFSSFRVIPQTVYIALELLLFMAAVPFLDTRLLSAERAARKEEKDQARKLKAPASRPRQEPRVIGTVRSSEHDPENQATTMMATDDQHPVDHQAITLDEEIGETVMPTKMGGEDAMASPGTPAPTESFSDPQPESIRRGESAPVEVDQTAPEAGDNGQAEELSDSGEIEFEHLGRYQVTGILGKGAMGKVYKGVDPAINRPVALKTMRLDFVSDPREEAELRERLHREAQAAGKLSHPNIVTIYDVGSEGHLQYIAMEYLEGQTLEEMIRKKTKFNYRIIAQIIIQICGALDYAHQQGIVHRDVKPANIMILRDYRVKVMDYGIARVDSSSMTKTGIAMGTPNYISPEQLQGHQVDHRADLFSLGVVMYELLLGQRPFKGENITALIYAILNHEPEKPSDVEPRIPLLFDRIIDRSLKKKPSERYQRAHEIAADLADFVESFSIRC